jgi:hypothetical protein
MRRLLLFVPFLAFSYYAQAQCTPDPNMDSVGMYPRHLPNATAGSAYSQVVQFRFPSDTTIGAISFTIDSVRIDSVTGAPPSFSYQCNKSSCTYVGNETGCATLSGNPVDADTGDYSVIIHTTGFVVIFGSPQQVYYADSVDFTVQPDTVSGFSRSHLISYGFSVSQNRPNPFTSATEISFTLPQPGNATLQVYDLLGKPVMTRSIKGVRGENTVTIDRKGMSAGMYFYSIQFGNQVLTKRMSVRN